MKVRTKEQQANLSDGQRYVGSLGGLLREFGFTFQRKPKSPLGVREVFALGKDERAEHHRRYHQPDGLKATVATYCRDGHGHVSDADVEYWILDFDPRAVDAIGGFNGATGLNAALGNLSHAAACGCGGCYDRIQYSWDSYQKMRVRDDSLAENSPA